MKHTVRKHRAANVHDEIAEILALKALVKDFAQAMEIKLLRKFLSEDFTGWDAPHWTRKDIKAQLLESCATGDPVDVANFAMFLWNKL